jgi:hypothetical protein
VLLRTALHHLWLTRWPRRFALQEDKATLASGRYAMGSNCRNALVVMKGEKEVCQHYVDLARIAVPLLELDDVSGPHAARLSRTAWCVSRIGRLS